MADGRMGGEIEPHEAAALGMVANPDNWRGLSPEKRAELAAEMRKDMPRSEQRKVDAVVAKVQKRGGRRG